eukprot:6329191-Amphidinium_carterae.1
MQWVAEVGCAIRMCAIVNFSVPTMLSLERKWILISWKIVKSWHSLRAIEKRRTPTTEKPPNSLETSTTVLHCGE